jgi:hypothetical protein
MNVTEGCEGAILIHLRAHVEFLCSEHVVEGRYTIEHRSHNLGGTLTEYTT